MKAAAAEHVPVPPFSPADEADKDKKRRLRSNRRAKQNGGASSCESADGFCEEVDQEPTTAAADVTFSSTPNTHLASSRNPNSVSPVDLGPVMAEMASKACPSPVGSSSTGKTRHSPIPWLPGNYRERNGASPGSYRDRNSSHLRRPFPSHWPEEAVKTALERGHAFRAVFRVNGYNRSEAYCTVDGMPIDVLINSVDAQNRAVEGDIVAIVLDPVTSWLKLKTSNGQLHNNISEFCNVQASERGETPIVEQNVYEDSRKPASSHSLFPVDDSDNYNDKIGSNESVRSFLQNGSESSYRNGNHFPSPDTSNTVCASEKDGRARALERISAIVGSYPSKRPTGNVVAIIERSRQRNAVVGFFCVQQLTVDRMAYGKQSYPQMLREINYTTGVASKDMILTPTVPKFPSMMVSLATLPDSIRKRLDEGDLTLEMELFAAQIDNWIEESPLPRARLLCSLGRSNQIGTQIAAILFENAICDVDFSPESLACLPDVTWKIPLGELQSRKDLRNICTFTIDPISAIDLDDALSVEKVCDDVYRVGVHIADVSYFVLPDSALDIEAQVRSTSVYLLQHKLSMLPPLLSEKLASLIPGEDKLTFSIIWEISLSHGIISQWIGRSIIQSCCKMSYECAQGIIDGSLLCDKIGDSNVALPPLYGQFGWRDIVESVRTLHRISKWLREMRIKNGALSLNTAKLKLLFDENGTPYDGVLYEQKDSNYLVEEFMLLANRSAAGIIARSFPGCSLLRRHPEPNLRKLKDFKSFCSKHGFEIDASSSSGLHMSLAKIKNTLKDDPTLFAILTCYASKPMQLASYFCSADLSDRENEWAHYSLAVPLYTHFTSPLRRYPDIVVHRTLSAVIEAENLYVQQKKLLSGENLIGVSLDQTVSRIFTSLLFDKNAAESSEGKAALSAAALKHKIPEAAALSEIAAYCNDRKLASRHAEEAGQKVYLWALLKNREILISEARVLGLGPRFMSLYIPKLAMERRICYNDVEGLMVEWLENTSTLLLDLSRKKHGYKKGSTETLPTLDSISLVVNPLELNGTDESLKSMQNEDDAASLGSPDTVCSAEAHPACFPLTLRLLSTIPVVLYAVGGDDGPPDIGVKLYISSYSR